jgi:hypothetical protein
MVGVKGILIESVKEMTKTSDSLRTRLNLPVWNTITLSDFFMKPFMLHTF